MTASDVAAPIRGAVVGDQFPVRRALLDDIVIASSRYTSPLYTMITHVTVGAPMLIGAVNQRMPTTTCQVTIPR
jgi:hypothetical protein